MNVKIIDYSLVESSNDARLVELVKGYIGSGWQPIGGIATVISLGLDNQEETVYSQAMVKYADAHPAYPKH